MSVFKVDHNYKVILNSDAAKLVPELKMLDEDQLLFVILSADYTDSPYRKKPEEERIRMAWRRIYGDKEMVMSDKLKQAIDLYKSLIFDSRRTTIDILKKKIADLHKKLLADDVKVLTLKEVVSGIEFLETRVEKLEKEVVQEEKFADLKGKKKMSMIEEWQMRQKEYRKFNEA